MKFDEQGRELPDSTPLELPSGMKQPESLESIMKRMIAVHASRAAGEAGMETFEEANDFEVEDDDEPITQYEYHGMKEEVPREQSEKERPSTDADSGRDDGEEEGKGGEVDDAEAAAESADGDRVSRSKSKVKKNVKPRSPERRRRRREDAESSEDEDGD